MKRPVDAEAVTYLELLIPPDEQLMALATSMSDVLCNH